ncbi:uncharacterized protein LOC126746308 [Anthonomus grandis grandis]|uniref:uncharacterized protein LOC126746308 n=1 Tax=Anthonomus grandis grandis TaxID=2921223 RepID=UPI00216545F9|nr:uncharacterized protein LOC126746308 [Anthonomus grandis grandis]
MEINTIKQNIFVCSDHILRSDFLYKKDNIISNQTLLKKSALPQRISDALVKNTAADNSVNLPSDLPFKAAGVAFLKSAKTSLASKMVYSTNSEANIDKSDHSSSTITASEINSSTVTVGSRSTITISHPSRFCLTATHSLTRPRKRVKSK